MVLKKLKRHLEELSAATTAASSAGGSAGLSGRATRRLQAASAVLAALAQCETKATVLRELMRSVDAALAPVREAVAASVADGAGAPTVDWDAVTASVARLLASQLGATPAAPASATAAEPTTWTPAVVFAQTWVQQITQLYESSLAEDAFVPIAPVRTPPPPQSLPIPS